MEYLNFGVIGVGEMGKFHAETLRYHVPEARLIAVADVNLARAKAVASDLKIGSFYDNTDSLLARTDIHAVVISSPPKFHGSAIRLAAAARKHIFCEKPLAITLEDADSALDAVRDAGLTLQVGHMRRYDSAYAEAKRRIDEGEIGRIVLFKSIGRDYQAPSDAAAQTELNGTLFHDSSSHDFDLARWLTCDEVTEVHAFAGSLAIPAMERFRGFDAGVVNLQFARGAVGNVESYIDARYGYDVRTEVVGTLGTIQVGYLRRTPITVLTPNGSTNNFITHWLDRFADAYRLEIREFVANVVEGRPVRVTGNDGRQSLAIADAAMRSHFERRPVPVRAARVVPS
ncbi:MAG: Gfo/Idh/MocA family oxidoreductase [Bryobacteraceae bacterium]